MGGRRRCLERDFAIAEMKSVLCAVPSHYGLSPVGGRPETTLRRSITFSPAREATVVRHERRPAMSAVPAPERAALAGT